MRAPTLAIAALLAFATTLPVARAATYALVTGVGTYNDPRNNLPCLDADIANIRRALHALSVPPSNIATLTDSKATAAAITRAFREQLARKCGPGDTAIFYFSGHGFHVPDQNGDEEDGQDEIIVPYGINIARPESYITDDQIADLIKEVRGAQVVVILDSCHSGTGTRSLDASIQKTWKPAYQEADEFHERPTEARKDGSFPYAPRPRNGFQRVRPEQGRVLALSACKAEETALGPKTGSLFTAELARLIEANPRRPMMDLAAELTTAVAAVARKSSNHAQHPEFEGNPAANLVLQSASTPSVAATPATTPAISPSVPNVRPTLPVAPTAPLAVAPAAPAPAPGQAPNVEIIQHRDFAVMIQLFAVDDGTPLANRDVKAGREVRVQLSAEKDCHVRLFHTDAHGRVTLVYPNKFQANDFVRAGAKASFPDSNDGFKFVVEEPHGPEFIKAVCSTEPFQDVQLPPEGNSPFFRTEPLRPSGLSSRGLGAYSTAATPTAAPRTQVGEAYVGYVVRK